MCVVYSIYWYISIILQYVERQVYNLFRKRYPQSVI